MLTVSILLSKLSSIDNDPYYKRIISLEAWNLTIDRVFHLCDEYNPEDVRK